ncbi:hypothetical protein [Streptomyces sp. XD-27]|uniref:hypothetical protein n=1 Tax=Streptomyces sp. XD-27 TaxID=3062779 RepID=UPI0026F43FE0|nr:hypothetical protein [Streptomyces sp. XD-27]WKX70919.1 hypothetical protein Q3Y56_14300 [Streptomyces sp. XD-27]
MSTPFSPERDELGRFFTITGQRFREGETSPLEMFSGAIDAEWHRMLGGPGYGDFCTETAGMVIGHAPMKGLGEISWVRAYENMFGPLPEVWFTGADGQVDEETLAQYRKTGTVVSEWDCGPTTGDGDDLVPTPRKATTR